MKFSSKVEKCGLSPMRKFHPYAVAAKARGINIYHLNIGQPDVQTPPAFFEAVRHFEQPVLAYAPSPGIPELIDAIQNYDDNGLPKTKNVLAKTKRECQEKLRQLTESMVGRNDRKVKPDMLFGDWLCYLVITTPDKCSAI